MISIIVSRLKKFFLKIKARRGAEIGHDVTGLDVSEGMLKRATENSAALHNALDFVQGDAEPFDEESSDAVVNRHVLWSLSDPKKALA